MSDSKKPRKIYGVSPETFVTTWQQSGSAKEVGEKLGMPKTAVLSRAAYYRKIGVQLKKMDKNPKRLNPALLNTIRPV